jgi:hypothetical protein
LVHGSPVAEACYHQMRQQLRFNIGWLALQENAFPTTGRMTGKPEVIRSDAIRAITVEPTIWELSRAATQL